jgi:beta-ketoacyl ACP synthase
LEDFDDQLTPEEARQLSYVQQMSTVLGRRVWQNAALSEFDPTRLMVPGTAMGGTPVLASAYEDMRSLGPSSVHPFAFQMCAANGASAAVALDRNAQAGVISPVSVCASGSEGIAQAWRHIVLGDADIAICGGVESKIDAVPVASMAQMQIVLSTLNLENLDPAVDLDVVSGAPRHGDYEYAVNNSFGFGGHNVALAFGRF